ncbi:MAG: hypothetical protein K6G15_11920 [Desulfovibrio sp.]|nr:hypothetical protein [Desulfovibrio sp.]
MKSIGIVPKTGICLAICFLCMQGYPLGWGVNGWNIQGMIALVKKSEPVALSGGLRFLALILGLLSIAGLSFLVSYIDTKMI